jgi:hypothetical protein
MVLEGDAERATEKQNAKGNVGSDLLNVAHQGSASELLRRHAPAVRSDLGGSPQQLGSSA